MRQGARTTIHVTTESEIAPEHAERFYELYLEAFGPLRTRAAARQVLHRSEFFEEMVDPRVWKYVAWSDTGFPIGLSTMTKSLDTVPWISPEYFEVRYPEQASRDAIYYLGFALVDRRNRHAGVFEAMLRAWMERLSSDRAVCAWDLCAYNQDIGFGQRIETLLHDWADLEVFRLDTQTYFAARYP